MRGADMGLKLPITDNEENTYGDSGGTHQCSSEKTSVK